MNSTNTYLNQYKKNELETANPEEIFILLYDAAINFLNKAKIALEENKDELFHKNLKNCQNIITEFMKTLDMDIGGKFAQTLYSLYRYYNSLLVKAGVSKNVDNINEVLGHLTNLRKTWKQAIDKRKSEENDSVKLSIGNTKTKDDYEDYYETEDDDDDDDDDDDEEKGFNGVY